MFNMAYGMSILNFSVVFLKKYHDAYQKLSKLLSFVNSNMVIAISVVVARVFC